MMLTQYTTACNLQPQFKLTLQLHHFVIVGKSDYCRSKLHAKLSITRIQGRKKEKEMGVSVYMIHSENE